MIYDSTITTVSKSYVDANISNITETHKLMMYDSEGRYIGVKNYEYISKDNYKLSERDEQDINLKRVKGLVFLGDDEKLYKVEKIHSDLYVLKELPKDEYVDYLHLII